VAESFRVGIGYDIHRLVEGRRLILGGIEIEHSMGLAGHSDADVLLHAVADAVLGAAGLPDIGDLYPDTDPAYKDADSRKLLADAMGRVRAAGYAASNLDVIVHAEAPNLSPYKRRIVESVAGLTGLPPGRVSVKAKTNEGLGPLGCGDAIACTAVAALKGSELP
jgi:2-C-methyl-D-erythritol 2,4-cyclodiphosphate synthase